MSMYLWIKWLHIISSVVLVGTGIGTAYFMLCAIHSGSNEVRARVGAWVVRADWVFTAPAVAAQPATGLWMCHLAGYSLSTPWLAWALGLYALAGACWLPVVWLQIKMARMAREAVEKGGAIDGRYMRYAWMWTALGVPAFVAMALIFALMVFKPS